jgi:hypothetical protein
MTNEATLQIEIAPPINMNCEDPIGIEKGTLLKLSDGLTASESDAQYDFIAGIAQSEKIASDGITSVAVFRQGIFEMTASGSIGVGDAICSYSDANYPNTVGTAKGKVAASGSAILGYALETASDAERILIDLNVGGGMQVA